MKTILLKNVMVGKDTLSYKNQLMIITRIPFDQAKGADIDEMRQSIRVLDALEKSDGDTVVLEDQDYEHLLEKVKNVHFMNITNEVVQFVDDIIAAGSAK